MWTLFDWILTSSSLVSAPKNSHQHRTSTPTWNPQLQNWILTFYIFRFAHGNIYLGLPMGTMHPKIQDCLPLICRGQKWLSSITILLSLGGKLQMVNVVLSFPPTYYIEHHQTPNWGHQANWQIHKKLFVEGPRVELFQTFSNLLENGLKTQSYGRSRNNQS